MCHSNLKSVKENVTFCNTFPLNSCWKEVGFGIDQLEMEQKHPLLVIRSLGAEMEMDVNSRCDRILVAVLFAQACSKWQLSLVPALPEIEKPVGALSRCDSCFCTRVVQNGTCQIRNPLY